MTYSPISISSANSWKSNEANGKYNFLLFQEFALEMDIGEYVMQIHDIRDRE